MFLLLQHEFNWPGTLEQDKSATTGLVCVMFPVDYCASDWAELREVVA
jgi:hypothetical protein